MEGTGGLCTSEGRPTAGRTAADGHDRSWAGAIDTGGEFKHPALAADTCAHKSSEWKKCTIFKLCSKADLLYTVYETVNVPENE